MTGFTPLKKCAALLLFAALIVSMSGCGGLIYANYRDLSSLQLIQTVGIDVEKGAYAVTVSTGESVSGEPPVIISRPGGSIMSATESVQNYSSSESLYFAHTEFVLFGENAGKTCLEEYLDYAARGSAIRLEASLFVVKDSFAGDLITELREMGIDITKNLSAISRDERRQGTAFTFSGREIAASTAEYGSALICAISPPKGGGDDSVDESEKSLVSAGYAIIRQGKLCGYLDTELVWAANMLLNRSGYSSMDLTLDDDLTASLHSVSGDTEYSAVWNDDGSLGKIVAEVHVEGHLLETSTTTTDDEEEAFLAALTAALEEDIRMRSQEVLNKSQKLESDFLGLFGILRKKYPEKSSALDVSFTDAMKNAEIEVSVKGAVLRSFDVEGIPQILDGGISE